MPRLPWRRLVNPFRPVEILSADQLEMIHRASLRILAEVGMEVLGDRAIDLLGRAGASGRSQGPDAPPGGHRQRR